MFHDVVLSKKRVNCTKFRYIHAETDALHCSLPADRALGLGFHGPVFMVTVHHPPPLQALHLHSKGDRLVGWLVRTQAGDKT